LDSTEVATALASVLRLPDDGDSRERGRSRSSPDTILPLTRREIEVLSLMADGARNSEIAAALYLSLATVKTHINHIFAKLGVSDRVHAILMFKQATQQTTEDNPLA
jgi:DNA-binding NarL/FixJ family response regulator